jgi:hypothetical protein
MHRLKDKLERSKSGVMRIAQALVASRDIRACLRKELDLREQMTID